MKTLIKLLIIASMLLSFNTSHAFWGDAGDKYVSVTVHVGEGVTESVIQLKNILRLDYQRGKYRVYVVHPYNDKGSYLGILTKEKDIKLVKKYLDME